MITVTEHTRRKGEAKCAGCKGAIVPGDTYREVVAVQEDIFEHGFTRLVAHSCCVAGDPCWEVTTRAVLHRRATDSLAFVRQRYGLTIKPGDRCVALGEPGEVVGGSGKYIVVKVDGRRHGENYHARDVVVSP